jgi:hypothetical protein
MFVLGFIRCLISYLSFFGVMKLGNGVVFEFESLAPFVDDLKSIGNPLYIYNLASDY